MNGTSDLLPRKENIAMKKKAIFTLITCSVAALFLICVLAVGLSENGFGLGTLFHEAQEGWDKSEGQSREYTWDPAETEVTGLKIDWVNGKIDVKVGSDNMIRITEQSAHGELKEDHQLKLSGSDGTLRIKWGKDLLFFNIFENRRKDLTVEVPQAVAEALEELSCSNTSGQITVSGFTAKEMNVSSTSGDVELKNLKLSEDLDANTTSGKVSVENTALSGEVNVSTTSGEISLSSVQAEKANLDTVSGAVSYNGSAREFDASTVSAAVRAELLSCPEEADLDSVSGCLTLVIPENSGFEVDYSSVSGNFTSDFPVTMSSGKSGRAKYSSGSASFQFSTTSGDMQVLQK